MTRYKDLAFDLERSLNQTKLEVLRLTDALKETNARLERELERGGNLQRELMAADAETEKLRSEVYSQASLIKRLSATLSEKDLVAVCSGEPVACAKPHVERERLPGDRDGKTFKLRIGANVILCPECQAPLPGSRVSGHLTLNRYPDGRIGEMFLGLDRSRRGDMAGTFAHQFAIVTSIALQYGVPVKVIADRLRHVRDESGGYPMREVNGHMVPYEDNHAVGSLVDLIAEVLERYARELGTWPKEE